MQCKCAHTKLKARIAEYTTNVQNGANAIAAMPIGKEPNQQKPMVQYESLAVTRRSARRHAKNTFGSIIALVQNI